MIKPVRPSGSWTSSQFSSSVAPNTFTTSPGFSGPMGWKPRLGPLRTFTERRAVICATSPSASSGMGVMVGVAVGVSVGGCVGCTSVAVGAGVGSVPSGSTRTRSRKIKPVPPPGRLTSTQRSPAARPITSRRVLGRSTTIRSNSVPGPRRTLIDVRDEVSTTEPSSNTSAGSGVGVGVAVADGVGVAVGSSSSVGVAVAVAVAASVATSVAVGTSVSVGGMVAVGMGVSVAACTIDSTVSGSSCTIDGTPELKSTRPKPGISTSST